MQSLRQLWPSLVLPATPRAVYTPPLQPLLLALHPEDPETSGLLDRPYSSGICPALLPLTSLQPQLQSLGAPASLGAAESHSPPRWPLGAIFQIRHDPQVSMTPAAMVRMARPASRGRETPDSVMRILLVGDINTCLSSCSLSKDVRAIPVMELCPGFPEDRLISPIAPFRALQGSKAAVLKRGQRPPETLSVYQRTSNIWHLCLH